MLFHLSDSYLLGMGVWLLMLAAVFVIGLKLRRRWKQQPRKLRLVHAALSLGMLGCALTAVELYFAIWYDQSDSFNMTNVSRRWFDEHVQVNPQGYRDAQPLARTVPAGQRRILFLGDSFTFGHGVNDVADRFSDRVGRALEEAQPGRFVVANLGIPAFDVRQVRRLLTDEVLGGGYQADVVVYTICLNDIESFDGENLKVYERIGAAKPSFFLFRDTYFFNLLYFRMRQFTAPEIRDYYAFVREDYAGEPWRKMQQELEALREACEAQQVDLRIMVFPFLHNLGPDYPFREAHRQIAAFCKARKIPVLDLEPVLSPHAGETLTVNRFDAHPNPRAHELAAEAMRKTLLSDLFDGDRR
jgi:lysophospholipase L1-like esterase